MTKTRHGKVTALLTLLFIAIPTLAQERPIPPENFPTQQNSEALLSQGKLIILNKLNHTVGRLTWENNQLQAVFANLRKTLEIQLIIDWEQLIAIGIKPDLPISLDFQNVPGRVILESLIQKINNHAPPQNPISFVVTDWFVKITPIANMPTQTCVYDVVELVNAPQPSRPINIEPASQEPIGFGKPVDSEITSDRLLANQIMDMIRNSHMPANWRERGGEPWRCDYFRGMLVITTTPVIQEQIALMLHHMTEIIHKHQPLPKGISESEPGDQSRPSIAIPADRRRNLRQTQPTETQPYQYTGY
jgi:hypothetical protein